jgi:RNA polymerase subunit RPABC4/transcription elongation factor Spt4
VLFRILIFIFGGWAKYKKANRNATLVVCSKCGGEQQKGTRFCRQCGDGKLVSIGEGNRIRQHQREVQLKDLAARARRNRAIVRIRQVSQFPVCDRCNIYLEDSPQFCTQCGSKISGLKMPVASVFQIVNREYPDLIRTEQDFETLRHEKPESGVVGRGLRLGFTQFADRISNPPKRSLKANVILWGSIIVITVIAVIIMLHVMSLMSLQDSDPSQ